jgi:RNA polymerase sigma factor (sigma-70 family)
MIRRVAAAPDDQAAWGELYDKLRPRVYYAAYRACRGLSDLAKDLVQAAFERLLRYADLSSFESDAQVAAYLSQIVWRLAVDERRRIADAESVDSRGLELQALVAHSSEVDAQLARSDLSVLAQDLPQTDQVLLGELLSGRTLTEIAERAGISYSAAAVRVHRLKDKLRVKIKT